MTDPRAVVCDVCGHTIGYRAKQAWTAAERAELADLHAGWCPGPPRPDAA